MGVMLGRWMELNFSQALMVGSVASFYTRPFPLILFAISIAAAAWSIYSAIRVAKKKNKVVFFAVIYV